MARLTLTDEERAQRAAESKQRYAEKKKLEKQQQAANYNATLEKLEAENNMLKNKVAELEKICKAYAESNQTHTQKVQTILLEANTKIQYMLDCAKHAYLAMQFAANSTTTKEDK